MDIAKLFFKLSCLIAFVILVKFSLKELVTQYGVKSYLGEHLQSKLNDPKKLIYFLGSSRMQFGIRTKMLNDMFNDVQFFNLGTDGGLFLNNIILADALFETKKPNVIIIELSSLKNSLTPNVQEICTFKKLSYITNSIKTNQLNLDFINFKLKCYANFFKNELNLSEELWHLMKSNRAELFEYRDLKRSYDVGASTILTKEMLSQNLLITLYEQRLILSSIHYLTQKAEQTNTSIFFLLPLTMRSPDERALIIPVFNALTNNLKVIYPDSLLVSIHDKKYLADSNHLNALGAEAFTSFLIQYFKAVKTGR